MKEIMKITIACRDGPAHVAPASLLGQQIEACYGSVEGMLSDRLTNPKFTWPADPRTGIAHKWRPTFTTMPGIHCELTANVSLSGNESQMVHCYWPETELGGIQQNGRQVRAGETLEVELWAKAMSTPVNIRVGIKPLSALAPVYDQADLCVNASYWKRYVATFKIPRDDNDAIFYIRLCGDGKIWIDQAHLRPVGEKLLCTDMIRHIESLRIPVMRFPGGTESNNYHWRHGIGPVHLRPTLSDPVFKMTTSHDFGTDEYLSLCHAQGITPHITINMGTGTPEEAGEWATYCARWFQARNIKLPLIYFEMGNEQVGHHEFGHMTPEMYVAALREFVPLVRAGYPVAKIIVMAEESYYYLRADQLKPWRKLVLEQAADLADVFVIHTHKGQWGETDEQNQINIVESVAMHHQELANLIRDVRAAGHKQPVATTEWTYLMHAGQSDGKGFLEPYDVMHCQYVAGVLHILARLAPDVELANFYQLVNPSGVFLHHGADVVETQMAEIFRLYRPAFPGEVLPLTNDSPLLGARGAIEDTLSPSSIDSVPRAASHGTRGQAVDALAMRCGRELYLFLLNCHPSQSARILPQGFPENPAKSVESVLLVGDKSLGSFQRSTPKYAWGELELPPLSLLRLRYTTATHE